MDSCSGQTSLDLARDHCCFRERCSSLCGAVDGQPEQADRPMQVMRGELAQFRITGSVPKWSRYVPGDHVLHMHAHSLSCLLTRYWLWRMCSGHACCPWLDPEHEKCHAHAWRVADGQCW